MQGDQPIARVIDSPVGPLQLVAQNGALTHIAFDGHHRDGLRRPEEAPRARSAGAHDDVAVLTRAAAQLAEFFNGRRTAFDLPLNPAGTIFQQRVWLELRRIPYGTTRSYADIARAIGNERAVRAVGAANGRNPLPIVVPCHRVIGRDGSLTGFAGGLACKRQLLVLEGLLPTS